MRPQGCRGSCGPQREGPLVQEPCSGAGLPRTVQLASLPWQMCWFLLSLRDLTWWVPLGAAGQVGEGAALARGRPQCSAHQPGSLQGSLQRGDPGPQQELSNHNAVWGSEHGMSSLNLLMPFPHCTHSFPPSVVPTSLTRAGNHSSLKPGSPSSPPGPLDSPQPSSLPALVPLQALYSLHQEEVFRCKTHVVSPPCSEPLRDSLSPPANWGPSHMLFPQQQMLFQNMEYSSLCPPPALRRQPCHLSVDTGLYRVCVCMFVCVCV